MIGRTVSHYEIVEQLGGGGMGVVYKCRDTRLDRWVALKFLAPNLARSDHARQRLISEAKAASALDHPNIGTIHEIDETSEGRLFIVMSYYSGRSLDLLIAGGPVPVDEALDIIIQIARGLARAHEKGIVHRDIKPANVLLTDRGQAKIVDFGLAKFGDIRLTEPGQLLGTPAYMSPEQARGEAADRRTDIWSLGVLMYEMFTRHLPFQGSEHQTVRRSILQDDPRPMKMPPGSPPGIENIIHRALAKDRDDRYGSVEELLADLGEDTLSDRSSLAEMPTEDRRGESATRTRAAPVIHRSGERRQATVLSCELAEFDAMAETLDPEDLSDIIRGYRDLCTDIVRKYEGHVVHSADDRLTSYFGYPRAHEDDAQRAVTAGLELIRAVAQLGADVPKEVEASLALKVGVHTGLVVVEHKPSAGGSSDTLPIVGGVSSVAAKVMGNADAGEILITAETSRIIRDAFGFEELGPRKLPGLAKPRTLLRVLPQAKRTSDPSLSLVPTDLVGRREELALLLGRWNKAQEGLGQLACLIGDAGIGKSRLLTAVRERVRTRPHLWMEAACSPYDATSALHPIINLLRQHLGFEAGSDEETAPLERGTGEVWALGRRESRCLFDAAVAASSRGGASARAYAAQAQGANACLPGAVLSRTLIGSAAPSGFRRSSLGRPHNTGAAGDAVRSDARLAHVSAPHLPTRIHSRLGAALRADAASPDATHQ